MTSSLNNPPPPPGYALLAQAAVTPEMTAWAIQVLGDVLGFPMFAMVTKIFGALTVRARVEWHAPDDRNPAIHRGVTLYRPEGSPMTTALAEGIDVSAYQPTVDWNRVAGSGAAFAFIKATEGTGIVDRSFVDHWTRAKASGILRGAYHFFRPAQDAAAQARHFLAQLTDPGELPPVIDVEVADHIAAAQIQDGVSAFIDVIAPALARPIVYTSPGFWNPLPARPDIVAKTDLWVANWLVHAPGSCKGYDKWTFWQYANAATVPGIPGALNVDANRFNGTLAELRAYSAAYVFASGGGAPPPSPPPPATKPTPDLTTTLGVQQALNLLGQAPPLKEDGVRGPKTIEAIEAFQDKAGLVVDGVAGPKTQAALRAVLSVV